MISFEVDGIEYRCFDNLFAVSRCGKVLRKYQPYQPTNHPLGYLVLGRQRLMHRVIATCWVDNPTGAKHVHHINENKQDNRADNLRWITLQDHAKEHHHIPYVRDADFRAMLRERRLGAKDTEETRAKKAAILSSVCPKTPCKYKGVLYPSVAAGGRAAQIPPSSFRLRCLSKNFPDYELLSLIS